MNHRTVSFRVRVSWLRTLLVMFITAAVVAPVAAFASHRFSDVPSSNTFHSDIGWLADAGVTKGCNPPTNTKFCPGDPVTREQMSAFMKRLAQNRVVDSDKVDGLNASAFAKTSAFYLVEGEITGVEDSSAPDNFVGTLNCGSGDVAIATGYIEDSDQWVWAEFPEGRTGTFAWFDDSSITTPTKLYAFVRCLDTNGNNTASASNRSRVEQLQGRR